MMRYLTVTAIFYCIVMVWHSIAVAIFNCNDVTVHGGNSATFNGVATFSGNGVTFKGGFGATCNGVWDI